MKLDWNLTLGLSDQVEVDHVGYRRPREVYKESTNSSF